MISLFLTPITLLLLSFIIKDRDIVVVSRLLFFTLMVNTGFHFILPMDVFYLKEAVFDIIMFMTVFLLKDNFRSLLIGIPCFISFLMNIIEQFSYYQTIFYPFREYVQFLLIQTMFIGLVYNCKWRKICKTNSQK